MDRDPDNLVDQLRQRETEIRMLREITELIGREHNLQTVLDRVAQCARDLIEADTVTIPTLSSDGTSYTYRAAVGAHADELLDTTLPVEVGICGWVLRHHKPWWRGALDQLDVQERNKWEQSAGTVILVPLLGRDGILGGITGIDKQGEGGFTRRDFDLLSLFAGQVSVAIENAMYVEALSEANRQAEAYRAKLERLNTRLRRTNAELQHLAVHDPLTGLPNRTLILDRLQQAMREAHRHEQQMALIMIDLDHFKEVNDTLGHSVGDSLLMGVGENFMRALREPDTLGRLGGDEFAVVLPETDRTAALTVVEKLQSILREPVRIDHNSFSIAASMGVALYPEHGEDASSLMRCADIAMYLAKRNRNDYAVYDPASDQNRPDRLSLLQDLRAAIQQYNMAVAFQPKLDLRSNCITGMEALARWVHPQRGLIPPYEFIPVLEHTGLIKLFTLQILDKSVAFCKACQTRGFPLTVAVNLSAINLHDAALPEQISEILDRYQLDKRYVTLEITESAIMHEPERCLDVLQALHDMGLYLSVDDFGTGYSSLSYLKRLPVKELKIDRSFVSDMIEDKDDGMIVHSTIDLAHNLGLATVAEGVESAQVLQRLRELGCDQAQGYLISRPLSPDDLLSYLTSGEWDLMSEVESPLDSELETHVREEQHVAD
jgi:diguanylate cyclase (GGDEF)-like protein